MEFDWVFDSQAYRKEHVEDFGNLMKGRVGKYLFVSTGSIYSKWDYGTPEEALLDFELNIPFKENQVNWHFNITMRYIVRPPYSIIKKMKCVPCSKKFPQKKFNRKRYT